jgi:hypothetical protein
VNNRTLTSANAILLISVSGLFDSPQRIQGFATDDITDAGDVQPGETMMGVDGRLSAGFVPTQVVQNIALQRDSLSNDMFESWLSSERSTREKYVASGILIVPATQRRYTMIRGFLTSAPPLPSLKRTLQPARYGITWERVDPAPYTI